MRAALVFTSTAASIHAGWAVRPELVFQRQPAEDACAAPVPEPHAADAEVAKLLEKVASAAAVEQILHSAEGAGLQEGTLELPSPAEAFNPFGFCPLHDRAERLAAAETAGGSSIRLAQTFDEFNAGIMAMGGDQPFNPATDPLIWETGPLKIESKLKLFDSLNGLLPTWGGIRQLGFTVLGVPAFLLTDGGNRTSYFMASAVKSCWEPDPLAMGPQVWKHSVVAPGMVDPQQKRGYYTATVTQHSDWFDPETILFLDGDRHRKFRDILELSGFARRYNVDVELARQVPVSVGCDIPDGDTFSMHVGKLVQKAIWGAEPPADVMDEILTYGSYGALGIFGVITQAILSPVGIAGQVKTARAKVAAWAETTPFAEVFLKARNELASSDSRFAKDSVMLEGMGVASLFAGLVGTMDMTEKCVKFQKQDMRHRELFLKHPEKYLIEVMRFDSAVTSVTETLQKDTTYIIEGRNITLKAGTPQQLVLATANRDPTFWLRPSEFDPDRAQLEETLSWNGRAVDVEARSLEKAPRHCPGMCLSLKVAAATCASFMGVFEELLEQGKILANDGEVKCNNFGEHDEPELWTPPEGPLPTRPVQSRATGRAPFVAFGAIISAFSAGFLA